jgi:hypothetical protein
LSDNNQEQSPRLKATLKEIEKLQQGNMDKVKALAGLGRAIDPGSVANIKIDTFIQHFLDEDAQAAYVLAMETNLRGALDAALSEIRQASLLQGVSQQSLKLDIPR